MTEERKIIPALFLLFGVFVVGGFIGYNVAGFQIINALSIMDKAGYGVCVLPPDSKGGKL